MAFGKSKESLSKITFSQQARLHQNSQTTRQPHSSTKRKLPHYVNQYKPVVAGPGIDPDVVRLIPGDYEQTIVVKEDKGFATLTERFSYYQATEHFIGPTKRSFICSGGPWHNMPDRRESCRGCDQIEVDTRNRNKTPAVSKRDLYIVTVLHFGNYVRLHQVDENGNVRTNQNGEPYYDWVSVSKYDLKNKYANEERRDWGLWHWALGQSHWAVLQTYNQQIAKSCTSCHGRDVIESVVWVCKHCGTDLVDPSMFSPQDLDKIINNPVTCSSCKARDFLEEIVQCEGCKTPERASIFDVDLHVQRTMENDSKKKSKTSLAITYYSNPKPLPTKYTDTDENGRYTAHPLDLPRIYGPDSVEVQEELMKNLQKSYQTYR